MDKKKMKNNIPLKKRNKISNKKVEVEQVEVAILLDHADKGKKVFEENINEERVRKDVPIFLENVDKGKKFIQDNMNDNEMRDDDWIDSGHSIPRFDIILDGSKSLEEKIDLMLKSYSCLKPTIDDWINRA
ncbi:unnamed protein product [Lactuca virosa]|uniref:Uncharacterized protein n=1 Tax=Lactuca virosa TaxID=75947 RepID=A0AAU9MPL1_9ASTR|nr:unnamed protein product [Lactuca virosa]